LKKTSVLTTIIAVTTILLISVNVVYGQEKVENFYFSLKVPNNWTYAERSNNLLALTPGNFADLLIRNEEDEQSPYGRMFDGGAYSTFRQDTRYSIKNAPLDLYVKHRINTLNSAVNFTTQQDAIIGNEKGVRIEGNGINKIMGLKYVAYLTLHDKNAYYLEYIANVKDYGKYLPEFEQLVKSFRFK
jgi:hypothetical protein